MQNLNDKNIEFSFAFEVSEKQIEVASASDPDLLKIRCFGTHEGLNENGLLVLRQVLKDNYRSLIDKPVVVVLDKDNKPTGHGYDFKRKKFIEAKRKYVGHVVDAFPCIVCEDGSIVDVSWTDEVDYPKGEFRILCDLVIYKRYLGELSETLSDLHVGGELKFSIEAVTDQEVTYEGIRNCTKIQFTGLAIVKNPAWKNSYSLEVAEKEERNMDFEQLYNDEKALNETLVAEKATLETEKADLITEKETLAEELTQTKEELASVRGELAEKTAEVETLSTYKEQVELAEKKALGEERKAKLEKYGEVAHSINELAEMTKEQFVDALEAAVDAYKPVVEIASTSVKGRVVIEQETKSNGSRLAELLNELCK